MRDRKRKIETPLIDRGEVVREKEKGIERLKKNMDREKESKR